MPIYEYKCGACGFQKEFLQRLSDAPLKDCPECGKAALSKMVTAAGFQLKGSGWYATDFKHGAAQPQAADKTDATSEAKADAKSDAKAETKSDDKSAVKTDAKAATETAGKKGDAPATKTTPAATPTTSS